ncbi:MAG: CsgG/HfaB family protein [Spirochaetia bacterium]|nr:CsgG/HfaB family protein [Spirochaetia bacterium]
MLRKSLILFTFLIVAFGGFAEEKRVAMVDFVVHSRNPDYEFLGKGISEMIAVELSNSPGLTLVEREKRVELMNEMKFALSGLAEDREKQIEVGNMLAADYLVFGEIVDMKPQLLISIRMTDVDSGEVIFREKLSERPGAYEYISGYFASAILGQFDVKVAKSTEKKTEEKREQKTAAVVAFSRAIEAYDRNEEGGGQGEVG